MKAKRLDNISILRVLCILVVVFFHCYGMMYADTHFPETVAIYKNLYFIPNQCIFINIAMPMFVFISGYLFEFLLLRGKYPTWGNLLRKKGLRILLPYFVFGLFFMMTTGSWHPLRLLYGNYWHLWFLSMIFWCFIVGYGVQKINFKAINDAIVLSVAYIGSFMPECIPSIIGMKYITVYFYWFYLGMLCYKYHDTLSSYLGKYRLAILLLICSIAIIILFPVEYGDSTWYGNFAATCCIVSISCLMNGIDWSKYKMTAPIVKFSSYSFGIYIWHNWVALMLISNTSKQLFGLPELAANHVILFPLCFSLITLAISWGLSWVMMKTKVGRFLIG